MKAKNILIVLFTAVVVVIVFYSFQGGGDDAAYRDELKKERKEKDNYMRTSAESPFAENPEKFNGLKYYESNPKLRIIAGLTPIQNKKLVDLSTNDGSEQRYIEYAYAEFDLGGFHNKLLILEGIDIGPVKGKLFLAFGDETSALETYGAGRYLDVARVSGSKTILLDFNKAYNPYCAYTEKFSCPLPPRENLLEIPIKAGEKTYH